MQANDPAQLFTGRAHRNKQNNFPITIDPAFDFLVSQNMMLDTNLENFIQQPTMLYSK